MPERNFPPPWSVGELDSCFVVKDLNGQALAYMYFEKELDELNLATGNAMGIARLIKKLAFLNQWRGSDDWRTGSALVPLRSRTRLRPDLYPPWPQNLAGGLRLYRSLHGTQVQA
jgi:hypothetical protein